MMNFAGGRSQRFHDATATVRSQSSCLLARPRASQFNLETRTIQRATGLASEVQQTRELEEQPMHSSSHDAEVLQEAEASGSSSRGIYKQASTSSSSSNSRGASFSYAPAESDQIRESWDSLMRWSKVRLLLSLAAVSLDL